MSIKIGDGLGTGQEVGVSPVGNRLNVSSRSDDRSYYVSRDNGDAYTITSEATAASGEYFLYFKNTSTTQKFYIKDIRIGTVEQGIFKLSYVDGEALGGSAITPVNLNKNSANIAATDSRGQAAISGITDDGIIDTVNVGAANSIDIDLHDSLILGQSNAIAIKYNGPTSEVNSTIFGFYDIE